MPWRQLKFSHVSLGVLLFTMVQLAGCGHMVGSGVSVNRIEQVEPFKRLIVSGQMTVDVEVGSDYQVILSGDDNVVAATDRFIDGDALRLRAPKGIVKADQLHITVVTPDLASITAAVTEDIVINVSGKPLDEVSVRLSGVGRLDINGLVAKRVQSQMDGTGQLRIDGVAEHLDFRLSGVGKAEFSALCLKSARVKVHGMGRVTVNTSEYLDAAVKGLGKITYLGDPSLSRDVTGGGKIEPGEDYSLKSSRCASSAFTEI